MEFIKHLKNIYDTKDMKKAYCQYGLATSNFLPQMSKPIKFKNDITLSIQGSFGHYCFPRETVPYNQYEAMEFACFLKNKFVKVQKLISLLPEENEYEEYESEGLDSVVYGYVPVELIEKLYQELKERYGLLEE